MRGRRRRGGGGGPLAAELEEQADTAVGGDALVKRHAIVD